MKVLNKTLLLALLVVAGHSAYGQQQAMITAPQSTFKDRIYFGGNLGLQFGDQTFIDVSPLVGYRFTEKLSGGIGLKYQYYKYKDPYYTYETNSYGGSVFARYNIWEGLFAYTEYEVLNIEAYDDLTRELGRRNIGSWFVGGGYSQPIGSRSSMFLMLLYNLNETKYTPYANPIIRVGFGIGI